MKSEALIRDSGLFFQKVSPDIPDVIFVSGLQLVIWGYQ
jgi:hypothetical protein